MSQPNSLAIIPRVLDETTPPANTAAPQITKPNRYLLSIDGGGVRGLSALIILNNIMLQVNNERKRQGRLLELKPCDIFDLIGGTSTGGLIAIMLGRLEMSVESCLKTYYKFIPRVFSKPFWKGRVDITGKIKPRYDSDRLRKFISETVAERERECGQGSEVDPAEVLLWKDAPEGKEPDCKVFVCATASSDSQTSLLRSYRISFPVQTVRPTIVQAALATTAAPSFFESVEIPIINSGSCKKYVDGALRANNPVDVVETEARAIWLEGDEQRTALTHSFVACFLSVGTGVHLSPEVTGSGYGLVKALKDIATETEETATKFYDGWKGGGSTYYRFSVTNDLQLTRMDEKNPEDKVDTATNRYIVKRDVKKEITQCAGVLANKTLNPGGIISLIESGQEALESGRFDDALKKFCQADKLVHLNNPDRLDLARFFATSQGMAESMFRMVRSRLDQGGIDKEVKDNMLDLLDGALKRVQDVRKETVKGNSDDSRRSANSSSPEDDSRRRLCQTALARVDDLAKLIEPLIMDVKQSPTMDDRAEIGR